MRSLYIGKCITRGAALRHAVHQQTRYLIAGIRSDGECLAGPRVYRGRACRADRAVSARRRAERVGGHTGEGGRDRVIRANIAESIAADGALAHAIHGHLPHRVADVRAADKGRGTAVGHTHPPGRADRAARVGARRDRAGRGDAELGGHVAFERLALGIAQGHVIDEEIAAIAVEG